MKKNLKETFIIMCVVAKLCCWNRMLCMECKKVFGGLLLRAVSRSTIFGPLFGLLSLSLCVHVFLGLLNAKFIVHVCAHPLGLL